MCVECHIHFSFANKLINFNAEKLQLLNARTEMEVVWSRRAGTPLAIERSAEYDSLTIIFIPLKCLAYRAGIAMLTDESTTG